jgi:hypothetical protein
LTNDLFKKYIKLVTVNVPETVPATVLVQVKKKIMWINRTNVPVPLNHFYKKCLKYLLSAENLYISKIPYVFGEGYWIEEINRA